MSVLLVLELLHVNVEMIVKSLLLHLVFWDERTASLLNALEVSSISVLDVRLVVLLAIVVGAAPKLVLLDLAAARENRLSLAHEIIHPVIKRRGSTNWIDLHLALGSALGWAAICKHICHRLILHILKRSVFDQVLD